MRESHVNSFFILILLMFITGTGGVVYFIHIHSYRVYLPLSFLLAIFVWSLLRGYTFEYVPVLRKRLSRILNMLSFVFLMYSWRYVHWAQYRVLHAWYILIVASLVVTFLAVYLYDDMFSKFISVLALLITNATISYLFLSLYPTIGNDTAFHTNAIRYIIGSGHFNSLVLGKYRYYPAVHVFETILDETLGISIRHSHYIWGVVQYVLVVSFSVLILRVISKRKVVPAIVQVTLSILLLVAPFLLQARFWYYISTYLSIIFFILLVSLIVLLPKLQVSRIRLYILLSPFYVLLSVLHPLIFLYLLILAGVLGVLYLLIKLKRSQIEQIGIVKTFTVFIILLFGMIFPKILMENWLISQSSAFVRKLAYVEPTEIVNVLSRSAPLYWYFMHDIFTLLVIIFGGAALLIYSKNEKTVIDTFLSITGGWALVTPFALASLFGSVVGARFLPFQELVLLPYATIVIVILLLSKRLKSNILGVTLLVLFIVSSFVSPAYGLGRFNYEDRSALMWSEIYPLKFTRHEVNLNKVYGNPLYFGLYFYFPKMAAWQGDHTFNPYLGVKFYTHKYVLLRDHDIKHGIRFLNFKYGDIEQIAKMKKSEVAFLVYDSNIVYSTRSTRIYLVG